MTDESLEDTRETTKRLYFEDATMREFSASVLEKRESGGRPALVLDKTCFYPESGGQPWDGGTIEGIEVLEVREENGVILHVLKEDLEAGEVRGRIDWERRFDHMQQHTGQHILSQAFFEAVKGETRSFHLGPDVSTLEIGLGTISEEDLDRVEDRANEIVWEDREVKTYFVPDEKIAEVPLRRPPKKQGLLRVVEVDGYDFSACGGTHCLRTGETGLIKVLRMEKIRGNIRFEFLCGGRALADYRVKNRTVREAAALFSTSEAALGTQAEKLLKEHKALKKRARKLEERLASFEAREVVAAASGPVVHEVFADRTADEARFLALNIIRAGEFVVIYGAASDPQAHIFLAAAESLNFDVRTVIPAIGAVAQTKGGGSPSFVELVTAEREKLAEAVEAGRAFVEGKLRPQTIS